MTHKLVRLALARLDAMQSKVALWTGVLAVITHESRWTDAVAIVLPTRGFVLALASVLAILSVLSIRTRFCAFRARPPRRTITFSRHVRALTTMSAIALVGTICAVPAIATRMLAGGSRVARSAFQTARYVMTLLRDILLHLALVLAIHPVESLGTHLVALVSDPARGAVALARHLIAG